MKKIICKKEYNTAISEIVKKVSHGTFGDPDGYEETLYRMPDGSFFLYVAGGAASPYTKEDIKRLSAKAAEAWLSEHN